MFWRVAKAEPTSDIRVLRVGDIEAGKAFDAVNDWTGVDFGSETWESLVFDWTGATKYSHEFIPETIYKPIVHTRFDDAGFARQ